MSLITGYDGILDTGIHAAALLLIAQNLAEPNRDRHPKTESKTYYLF